MAVTSTRSGQIIQAPQRLIEEIRGTAAEAHYYGALAESENGTKFQQTVGAQVGGGFQHTCQLYAVNCDDAMKGIDAKLWGEEADNVHNRITKNNVWEVVNRNTVTTGALILNHHG